VYSQSGKKKAEGWDKECLETIPLKTILMGALTSIGPSAKMRPPRKR